MQGVTKADFDGLRADVKRLLVIMNGNGKLGVVARVFRAEDDIAEINKGIDRTKARVWQVFMKFVAPWILVTAAAAYVARVS